MSIKGIIGGTKGKVAAIAATAIVIVGGGTAIANAATAGKAAPTSKAAPSATATDDSNLPDGFSIVRTNPVSLTTTAERKIASQPVLTSGVYYVNATVTVSVSEENTDISCNLNGKAPNVVVSAGDTGWGGPTLLAIPLTGVFSLNSGTSFALYCKPVLYNTSPSTNPGPGRVKITSYALWGVRVKSPTGSRTAVTS